MKAKRMLATALALILALAVPALTLAEDASGKTYTIEEMLTLALQNEYTVQAQYTAIADAFQAEARLNLLNKAGSNHVAALTALLEAYGFAVPENTADAQVKAPATLEEAYRDAVKLATQSTDLYESFLAQENLPESLRTVFAALKDVSQNHLNAFARFSQRIGRGPRMNRGSFNRSRRGTMPWNGDACPFCGGSYAPQSGN